MNRSDLKPGMAVWVCIAAPRRWRAAWVWQVLKTCAKIRFTAPGCAPGSTWIRDFKWLSPRDPSLNGADKPTEASQTNERTTK